MADAQGAKMNGDRSGWLYPLSGYEEIAASLEELGNVERIPPWVLEMVRKAQGAKVEEKPNESRVPDRLLPYQLEGLRYGVSRGGRCLIGDEMGLGKTLQALALAAHYVEDLPVLVVCPSSLRWVWKEQAEQWLPELMPKKQVQVIRKGTDKLDPAAKMWIISYNLLASGMKNGNFEKRPDGTPHAMVIADESHNIKEWKAARTKALIPLLRAARRAVLLSGTPTRNSADELHPQLCGLIPHMPANFQSFRSRYCIQQQSTIFGGKTVSKVVGARNAAELNHLLTSTVMVRRLKKEVLTQLPEKRRQRVPVEVSNGEVLRQVRNRMEAISSAMFAGDSEAGEAYSTLFKKLAQAKLPAVKEYLEDVLERGDEKVIVFAHHQVMMEELSDLLAKNLKKEGLTHVRIDGKTSQGKRPELVKRFQEDPAVRVALLSITACGEGISLTAAGLVIFAELYWVPGAVEQAEARAHRLGSQHSRVVVEYLVVPNSPDEHIYSSLDRKAKDTSHMLNGAAESLGAVAAEERPTPPSRKRGRPPATAATPEDEVKRKRPATTKEEAKKGQPGEKDKEAASPSASTAVSEAPAPPPVSRSKVEFLLRAARAGAEKAG